MEQQIQKSEHAVRIRTDIAASLTALAKDYDALVVIEMTAAFLGRMLNACILSKRLTTEQASDRLIDITATTFTNIADDDAPRIVTASGGSTGRLQ